MRISNDTVVDLALVLRDEAGTVLDEATVDRPWSFVMGSGACPAGLEEALLGAEVGHLVELLLPPERAYGPYVEAAAMTVDRGSVVGASEAADLRPGMRVSLVRGGLTAELRITAVEGDRVRLDANHPLAGQTIYVAAEVCGARAPRAADLLGAASEPSPSAVV